MTIRASAAGYRVAYLREASSKLKRRPGRKENRIPIQIVLEKEGRPKDSELKVDVSDAVDFGKTIKQVRVTVRYTNGSTNYQKTKTALSGIAHFFFTIILS